MKCKGIMIVIASLLFVSACGGDGESEIPKLNESERSLLNQYCDKSMSCAPDMTSDNCFILMEDQYLKLKKSCRDEYVSMLNCALNLDCANFLTYASVCTNEAGAYYKCEGIDPEKIGPK